MKAASITTKDVLAIRLKCWTWRRMAIAKIKQVSRLAIIIKKIFSCQICGFKVFPKIVIEAPSTAPKVEFEFRLSENCPTG